MEAAAAAAVEVAMMVEVAIVQPAVAETVATAAVQKLHLQ